MNKKVKRANVKVWWIEVEERDRLVAIEAGDLLFLLLLLLLLLLFVVAGQS